MSIESDRAQVRDQCRVIAHMCEALAKVHHELAVIYANGHMDQCLQMKGEETAAMMETLGDFMNDMDIVEPEDSWCSPIIEAAHVRFPLTTSGSDK